MFGVNVLCFCYLLLRFVFCLLPIGFWGLTLGLIVCWVLTPYVLDLGKDDFVVVVFRLLLEVRHYNVVW